MNYIEKKLCLIGLMIFFSISTVSMFSRELYFGSILTAALVYCFFKVMIKMEVEDEN